HRRRSAAAPSSLLRTTAPVRASLRPTVARHAATHNGMSLTRTLPSGPLAAGGAELCAATRGNNMLRWWTAKDGADKVGADELPTTAASSPGYIPWGNGARINPFTFGL